MGVKMNLRIIRKDHAADPGIAFFTKIDLKAVLPRNGHAASVGVSYTLEELFSLKFGSSTGRQLSPVSVKDEIF